VTDRLDSDDVDVVGEQIAYYRAQAPEYDAWFEDHGRPALSPTDYQRWLTEVAYAEAVFEALQPLGRVLEVACGTGHWTERLAPMADLVVAVDAAPGMIDRNRRRLGPRQNVHYIQADVFRWQPARTFDTVFAGMWLSHVPADRFDDFWSLVDHSLDTDGRVLLFDEVAGSSLQGTNEQPHGHDDEIVIRQLDDGRQFRIVKTYHSPAALRTQLAELGWDLTIETTTNFLVAHARRAAG
jgi:SAM-dependent methyltransferase